MNQPLTYSALKWEPHTSRPPYPNCQQVVLSVASPLFDEDDYAEIYLRRYSRNTNVVLKIVQFDEDAYGDDDFSLDYFDTHTELIAKVPNGELAMRWPQLLVEVTAVANKSLIRQYAITDWMNRVDAVKTQVGGDSVLYSFDPDGSGPTGGHEDW